MGPFAGTVGLEVAPIGSSLQQGDGDIPQELSALKVQRLYLNSTNYWDHSAGTVGVEGVATIESSLQPIKWDHSAGTVGLEGVKRLLSLLQQIGGPFAGTVGLEELPIVLLNKLTGTIPRELSALKELLGS